MGLTYVKAIIKRAGGRIWCESKPGVGTTFSFTVPRSPEAQINAPASLEVIEQDRTKKDAKDEESVTAGRCIPDSGSTRPGTALRQK
jgi:hypothetical protein